MQGSSQTRQFDPATSPAVQQFLRDIEASIVLPPHVSPALAAVTTICTLTMHRLSAGEARDVLEALPRSLHELFRPCERQGPEAGESLNREQFLARVAQSLPTSVHPLIQRCAVHPDDQLPYVDANDFMLRVAVHLDIDVSQVA